MHDGSSAWNPSLSRHAATLALAALLFAMPGSARAQDANADPALPEPTYTITVEERRPVSAASAFVKDARSFELRAPKDPGEILEVTPGLMTAQHAGGGKANQYLVRGFDADHGTDLAVSVDGVPVNMRSHAHGQGYLDLHFVIPEAIERIEITKGPYDAEVGDFATAGSVNLVTRDRVKESFAKVELGEFRTQRYLALLSPRHGVFAGDEPRATSLFAFEAFGSDGPFRSEDDLWRFTGLGRVGYELSPSTRLEAMAHGSWADWDASGQVPRRAVRDGRIDRFGSIDPTEGGTSHTVRSHLRLRHEPSAWQRVEATAWFIDDSLELFSNFTFFLEDPRRGDGIVQRDRRQVYGGSLVYRHALEDTFRPLLFSVGLDTRHDDARVLLAHQERRRLFERIFEDDVRQTSLAGFAQAEVLVAPWVRTIAGLRGEQFWFRVRDRAGLGNPQGSESDGVVLPKASVILSPFGADAPLASDVSALRHFELFLNYGRGFHSNDARGIIEDPGEVALPRAHGYEVGARTRIGGRLDLALAHWWLNLQRELVFEGDEGTTEVNPRSRRRGVEASAALSLADWLMAYGDVAYTRSEFSGGDKVPNAPRLVASGGLVARHESGLSAELRYKHLGSRYGTEDRSPRLHAYGVWSLGARYRWRQLELSVNVENLFDSRWESAEFFYASRLRGEPAAGIEDFHFVPGYPRHVRAGIAYYF